MVYADGKVAAVRVLFVGLGPREKCDPQTLFKAAALAASRPLSKASSACAHCGQGTRMRHRGWSRPAVMAEGSSLGHIAMMNTSTAAKSGRPRRLLPHRKRPPRLKKALPSGRLPARQNYAALQSTGQHDYAGFVVEAGRVGSCCKRRAGNGRTKMGGIWRPGSANTPRLIVLRQTRRSITQDARHRHGRQGHYLDSGGISSSQAEIQDMKFDKSGGIAVLAAMWAIANLKPKVPVIGLMQRKKCGAVIARRHHHHLQRQTVEIEHRCRGSVDFV